MSETDGQMYSHDEDTKDVERKGLANQLMGKQKKYAIERRGRIIFAENQVIVPVSDPLPQGVEVSYQCNYIPHQSLSCTRTNLRANS
jgi:hypothetical protein